MRNLYNRFINKFNILKGELNDKNQKHTYLLVKYQHRKTSYSRIISICSVFGFESLSYCDL